MPLPEGETVESYLLKQPGVHKDEEGVYVYSLADFTAQQGVRDTTDVMEKYRKGALGALPDPELINSLLSIKSGVKGDDADAK